MLAALRATGCRVAGGREPDEVCLEALVPVRGGVVPRLPLVVGGLLAPVLLLPVLLVLAALLPLPVVPVRFLGGCDIIAYLTSSNRGSNGCRPAPASQAAIDASGHTLRRSASCGQLGNL
jgi:hypothetical protein